MQFIALKYTESIDEPENAQEPIVLIDLGMVTAVKFDL
jgi:hypothetical protein